MSPNSKMDLERGSPPIAGEIETKTYSMNSEYSSSGEQTYYGADHGEEKHRNIFGRMVDGFKPPTDIGKFAGLSKQDTAIALLSRSTPKLSKRHLMIISASGCVGTGLFIGSGSSLKVGGPAALLIGFAVMGLGMICTMCSIGELAVRYPTVSPFYELPARLLDPSFGFACGWIYAFCWMVTVPLELIAGAELTQFWKYDNNSAAHVNPVAWVSILYVFDLIINFSGSRAYGELEFFVGFIKVSAMIGFILFGIINVSGGPPTDHYLGGHYWYDPKPFMHGFKGVVQVIVSCSFAYGGTEVSGIAAAETANPLKAIPSAVRQVFWRVIIFFIVGITLVSLMVSPTASNLGNSDDGSGSPFVLAISNTGVRALPSIFNAVIICSVIGVSNAAFYASTRTLTSLAVKGAAPPYMCYIDRRGRPLGSMITVAVFALLCFVSASNKYNDVFNWLYAFASLAFLFAWAALCLCFLRFRWALKVQGRSPSELVYKSMLGIPGGIIGAVICIGTLGLQFWIYLFPIGSDPDPKTFFQNDLSVPVILALFIGHKVFYWKTSKIVSNKDLDLDSGVRDIDLDALHTMEQEDYERNKKNPLRRIASVIC